MKTSTKILGHGQMHLTSASSTTCTDADTYYKIEGSWSDGCSKGFVVDDVNGRLVYNGPSVDAKLSGASDVEVNTATSITYALYKNGVLVSDATTPHDFAHASKTDFIGISRCVPIKSGDYFEVWVKASDAGRVVTSKTLQIDFVCMR